MKLRTVVNGIAVTALAMGGSLLNAGTAHAAGQSELAQVRAATEQYHDVNAAGPTYQAFLPCMDSSAGGMGQHYVDFSAVGDPTEDATHPEALVYEVTPQGLKLAAVEYIVPAPLVDPNNIPTLFGVRFHLVTIPGVGDLYVLHAWIWKPNPSGIFQDWNPKVGACPSGSMG
jgi:hypothetical protein